MNLLRPEVSPHHPTAPLPIDHAFDLNGNRINWLDTGRGASALTGLAFGGDGKLYFCDIKNDRIVRIDP